MFEDGDISDDIMPQSVNVLGNYAAQISWEDGFNQVAPFDLLVTLPCLDAADRREYVLKTLKDAGVDGTTAASEILARAGVSKEN